MTIPATASRLPLARGAHEQGALLEHLRERSLLVDSRAQGAAGGLSAEALARPRANGGWGVGQLLEHLVMAADDYLGALERRLATDSSVSRSATHWRASVVGRMLIRSLDESARRRMPAPPRWRVGKLRAAPDVLNRFLATQERLRALIERARGHDLTRVRFASPVLPLLRMNGGDALAVVVVHSERHMSQLERAAHELRGNTADTR